MNLKVYVSTPDGRVSKSWYYKKGQSAIAKRNFLIANNPKSHCIFVMHRPTGRYFCRPGTR